METQKLEDSISLAIRRLNHVTEQVKKDDIKKFWKDVAAYCKQMETQVAAREMLGLGED